MPTYPLFMKHHILFLFLTIFLDIPSLLCIPLVPGSNWTVKNWQLSELIMLTNITWVCVNYIEAILGLESQSHPKSITLWKNGKKSFLGHHGHQCMQKRRLYIDQNIKCILDLLFSIVFLSSTYVLRMHVASWCIGSVCANILFYLIIKRFSYCSFHTIKSHTTVSLIVEW